MRISIVTSAYLWTLMLPAEAPHCKKNKSSILSSSFLLIFRFVETGNVLFGTLFMKTWFLSCNKSAGNMSPKWFVRFAEAPHCRIKRDIDRGRSFFFKLCFCVGEERRRIPPPLFPHCTVAQKQRVAHFWSLLIFLRVFFIVQLDLLYKSHKYSKTYLEVVVL